MIRFNRFPIGFWPNFGSPQFVWNQKEVDRWKDCGITLTNTP